MTEGRLETESRCQECLAIIKGEVTSNNLSKRRVRTRTHGVVGGRGLVAPSYRLSWGGMRCSKISFNDATYGKDHFSASCDRYSSRIA